MTSRNSRRTSIMRPLEWCDPPPTARREIVVARPSGDETEHPPVLLVPGLGHGAWVYTEHWLDHIAERGFYTQAMSPRGQGRSAVARRADLRAYVHDVAQVAACLPRQAVLVGHGVGALIVAMTMARYPARAGVLVAPVFGGLSTVAALVRANPARMVSGLVNETLSLHPRQLFSGEVPSDSAREFTQRLDRVPRSLQTQLARSWEPERAVGDPPVLVLGSPDDRIVSSAALTKVAACYGGAPLLFPGMGHEMPLDARWREPADAICDWLMALS